MDLTKYSTKDLKSFLSALKDKTSGNKQELLVRLQNHGEERVKAVIAQEQNHNETADLLNLTQESNSGEEQITQLRGEVATLTATVNLLVQKLQNVVTGTGARVAVDESQAACVAVSTALPNVNGSGVHTTVAPNVLCTQAAVSAEGAAASTLPVDIANTTPRSVQSTSNTLNTMQTREIETAQLERGGSSNWTMRSGGDVRDMTKIMPEFNPGKGMSSRLFVERIEQLGRAYGWCEQLILYAVYEQLKGPAKQWINAMPIFNSWTAFAEALMADFPSAANSAELNMQMMQTRIERGESYVDFYYRMLMMGRSGGMEDSAIITYIINGLNDETVKKILSAMRFAKCADLLKTLSNMGTEIRKPYSFGTTMQFKQDHVVATKPEQNTVTSYKNQLPNQAGNNRHGRGNNTRIVCYRCRETGHLARNCTKARTVYREAVNNINTADAEDQQANSNSSVNNIAPEVKVKDLRKEITIIGGKVAACVALIDSGSGRSLIKRSLAEKVDGVKLVCHEKLLGFAGGEWTCVEKINVTIKFDQASYPAQMLIIEDDKLAYDALIGIDVLGKGKVIIENGVCQVLPINVAEVKVDANLPTEVVSTLYDTLNEYAHCFGEKLNDLGKSKTYKMNITLTSNKPVVRKPYPIPIPKQQIVEKLVDKLLELDIVESSNSYYSSPMLLVKKANGEDRLCVDFRELNSITDKQPWHMPTVEGVLAKLANSKFYTTLDMMSGYYQIELDETSRQYTGFVTHHGHFQFKRMPFGLRNAPCAFQRMMSELIAPLGNDVISYVDEVIIATTTAEENLTVLRKFLILVAQEGLTLRVSKCAFLMKSVSFLGHELDENGIRPGSEKTKAIENYHTPSSQQEVRRFLGLAGFFRKFVPNFASVAKPLTSLLKKDTVFVWSIECENAFTQLQRALASSPILTVYDVAKRHELHTDASSVGLAAILLQEDANSWGPVAYFSRGCNPAETKYHAYELETLAVVEACERFRTYLLGKEFVVVTDCQAIASAKSNKPMVPRVVRWFLRLSEFDCQIVHRSGESMRHVDALSRAMPYPKEQTNNCDAKIMEISVEDWVFSLQKQDPQLKSITDVLTGVQTSEQVKQIKNEYTIQQHRLFKKANTGNLLLVVPKGMRSRIVKMCHDDVGHPGVSGTITKILTTFWFARMRNFVKGYVGACLDCNYHRQPKIREGELFGMDVPRFPFEVLHMDHLGPFVKSRSGNEYVLVIVDALTRYTVVTSTKTTRSTPVINALNQLTLYFGLPEKLITDRGTAFTAAAFADYCQENNIQHIKVAVRTPRANGLAERVNQAVLQYLKPSTADPRDWDKNLRMLQWTLNTKKNATTKVSAIELVFDFPLRDISGNKLLTALHDDVHVEMNSRRSAAEQNINKAREQWKKRFDNKHQQPRKYNIGDLVLLEMPFTATGESRKLQPAYRGPYEVKKILRFDRYVIGDMDGLQQTQRKFSTIATVDKMKPYCCLYPELDEPSSDDEV